MAKRRSKKQRRTKGRRMELSIQPDLEEALQQTAEACGGITDNEAAIRILRVALRLPVAPVLALPGEPAGRPGGQSA